MKSVEKTHLGVYGVLIKDSNILMIKKGRGPYTGKFDLPGGKLEHGEDIQEGLARELQEETGVIVYSAQLLTNLTTRASFEYENEFIDMYQVGLIYKITDANLTDIQTETSLEDSLGAIWIDYATVDRDSLSPFARKVIEQYL